MRRRILICAGAALGSLLVFAAVVFKWRPQPTPNLLVITLDTTRADRLGCYGYKAARTPALDSLAAEGALCERAYTVAPLTFPAHTSLFTGLYPAETGVRTNGRGRLDDSIPTLAQHLTRHGYDTGAFVAAFVLDKRFGLDRGFKTYDDEYASAEPDVVSFERRRPGDKVVDAALAWLAKKRTGPFFCWVHLFDPHLPYLPHGELADNELGTNAYDGEIAFADRQVGRLLAYLREHNLDEQTLVVVVGDHGEGLGEHEELTHTLTLYDSVLQVPMIWRRPGLLPAGHRLKSNVSLVDVYPTILDELGIRPAQPVSGRSLRTALSGTNAENSMCYAATDEPFLQNGWSPLRALVAGNWKFIRTTKPELYDLASDPRELKNLIETNPVQRQNMERQLADFESRLTPRLAVEVQLSQAERRTLASLGYTAAVRRQPAAADAGALPDVKDMLALDKVVDEAQQLASRGSLETAIRRLQEVVHRSPGHARAALVLADALIQKSEFDEAAAVYLNLLEVNPEARGAHSGLGNTLVARERYEEAAAEYQKELDLDPLWVEAHYQLARLAQRKNDSQGALRQFEAMLEIDGSNTFAYKGRGDLFRGMGRIVEAIADYRKVLQFNPTDAATEHDLGILLSDRDAADARRRLQHAVELAPHHAEYRFALGTLFMQQRDYASAVEQLARALELMPESQKIADRLERARAALRDDGAASP